MTFVFLLTVWYFEIRYKKIYFSVIEYCEKEEIFCGWRKGNPYIYIGLSDEGKRLLRDYINAYDIFLKFHPFLDGKGFREYLMSLFDDLPPRPNKPPLATDASCPTKGSFLFKKVSLLKFFSYKSLYPDNVAVK